tara:strand:- start:313 stop:519 length:207 start_codon:yes stop_codon:yes gene_type:complete
MSKIAEQLRDLKLSIDSVRESMKKIRIENSLLQQQQGGLVTEKAELIKKNQAAKEQIEAILERLKNIE